MKQVTVNEDYKSLIFKMKEAEYLSLKNSILENSQRFPIIINKRGVVLDGHHRLKACKELGIEPKFEVRKFKDELEEKLFIIEANVDRRHLNLFQRAHIALAIKPLLEELAKRRMSEGGKQKEGFTKFGKPSIHVQEELARRFDVSKGTLSSVEKILSSDSVTKAQLKDVQEGKITINKLLTRIRKAEKRKQFDIEAQKTRMPNSVNLQCGDFNEVSKSLKDNSIDLLFTDPPYAEEHLHIYKEVGVLAKRILKEGGSLIVYAGRYFLPKVFDLLRESGLKYWWTIALHEHGPVSRPWGRQVFSNGKFLLWFVNGQKLATTDYVADIIDSDSVTEKHLHEWAQSPVEAKYIIEHTTFEGATVLDVCMGSGTTGIAALELKRKFIGVEIGKERFDVAERRISQWLVESKKPKEDYDLTPFQKYIADLLRVLHVKEMANENFTQDEVRHMVGDAIKATANDIFDNNDVRPKKTAASST